MIVEISLNLHFIKQILENGNYQALLRIARITEEDLGTKFTFHAANEIGEADYNIMLSVDQMSTGEFNTIHLA